MPSDGSSDTVMPPPPFVLACDKCDSGHGDEVSGGIDGEDDISSQLAAVLLPPLAAAGAKLLPATHPAFRRLAISVRVAQTPGNNDTAAPQLLPIRLFALAIPLLEQVPAAAVAARCAGSGAQAGALLVAGVSIHVRPPPLVPSGTADDATQAAPPPACSGSDAYLETAGLAPALRHAAAASRARGHALVWLAAFTPPAAGTYSVALAYARNEEHIASSPYLVAIA